MEFLILQMQRVFGYIAGRIQAYLRQCMLLWRYDYPAPDRDNQTA
jgi:hypothetical protein